MIVPSLPGHPGRDRAHAARQSSRLARRRPRAADKSGLEGADLAGSSVGGSFVAEMAALWPMSVRKIALIAPFGLFDEKDPPADIWAQKGDNVAGLLCADAEKYKDLKAVPPGANSVEWPIEQMRASEAAARVFWPLGNTQAARSACRSSRRRRCSCGASRIASCRGATRTGSRPRSKARAEIRIVPDAGHLAELDQPDEVAKAILDWTA